MPQSVDIAPSSEDTAPHACAQTCVIQTSEEDGRGEQDKREKQGEADVGKGAPGPGQLLRGGPSPPNASWLGLWSDPRNPQRDGHRDSWSLRAALGSCKPPRQDEERGSALSSHEVCSTCLAPGIRQ